MPNTTTNYQFPYPSSTDPANISQDIGNLAIQADTELYGVYSSLATNYVYAQNNRVAENKDFVICDSATELTISLPTSPASGTEIKIFNQGTENVTVSTSMTINGSTIVNPLDGATIVYLNSEWWCLPLSSSQQTGSWTRPSDWIIIPSVLNTEEVVYGIVKLYDYSTNSVGIKATGNYTVDWGDGVTESFTSGTVATHTYNSSLISESTRTSDNFKQVMFELRPQAGSNFTGFGIGSEVVPIANISEIVISGPLLTSLLSTSINTAESIIIKNNSMISISDAFSDFYPFLAKNIYIDGPVMTDVGGFGDCPDIQKVVLNSSTITTLASLFSYTVCPEFSITSTSLVTDFSQMFYFSSVTYEDLISINMNTQNGNNFGSMFYYCKNLRKVPNYNLDNATAVNGMFDRSAIEELPAFNLANVTEASQFCYQARSLHTSNVIGLRVDHSYEDCNLSSSALNIVYTNLGTAVPSAVITVSGNPGITGDNPTIATAKGWTVTG